VEDFHGQVPILGVTAQTLAADQSEMLAAGMDAILLKPFRRKSLLEAIDGLLGRPQVVS
jgi:CheY-like chemotaxis protein